MPTVRPKRRKADHDVDNVYVFTSADIVRMAPKITLRQLQWWDERNLIVPHHEGHRRLYSREQAFVVLLVESVRARGMSLQECRKLLRNMRGTASTFSWMCWNYLAINSQFLTMRGFHDPNELVAQLHSAGPTLLVYVPKLLRRVDSHDPRLNTRAGSFVRADG